MIVIGTTLAAFVMDQEETWRSWLDNAEAICDSHPDGVRYMAAIETDARGLEPFAPLLAELEAIGGDHWTFTLDDGRTEVTTANRLRHITCGQNLVTDFAISAGATHLLFLAADLQPPPDVLPKLLELDHPIVGIEIPTYCLSGPDVPGHGFPVQAHMASAAGVMIRRDLLRFVRWRWDLEAGMSDDPCLHHDCLVFHGVETLVRKDCVGRHMPETIGPIEQRGHDMRVHR